MTAKRRYRRRATVGIRWPEYNGPCRVIREAGPLALHVAVSRGAHRRSMGRRRWRPT